MDARRIPPSESRPNPPASPRPDSAEAPASRTTRNSSRTSGASRSSTTGTTPATMKAALSKPDPQAPPPVRRKTSVSRGKATRTTIQRLEPLSVFKISIVFYLGILVIFMAVGALLWMVASVTGTIHGINHFVEQLFGYQSFSLAGAKVILGTLLVGLCLSVLGSLVNVVLAMVYNGVSHRMGGIKLLTFEEDQAQARVGSRSRSGL